MRLRTSTVEGLSNTASFCVETRLRETDVTGSEPARAPAQTCAETAQILSPLGW